ncbi:glycosyltransferase family 1 protein [Fibrobacter sp.]|uniref:glycosyltransferase family 1 protein n=1 Tax=Fibrobacter sp. TaxID=35828 RepID=UPI003890B72D
MIRVLHVLGGLDRGGAETMVMNLYRAIDKKQVQFDFITHTNRRQAYTEEIEKLGGKIYYFPKFKGINFLQLKSVWKKFFKDHPEYKILHSHVRSYASLYLPIAKKAGLKTIIHSHNTSSGKGIKAIVKWFMQRGLRKNLDYYFACSDVAGKWLFGEKIVNQPNYFLLKNAIDVEKYAYSESSRKKIRDEFNLNDKFVVGHVGRFHPQKNHLFLVDIFAEIHKKCPDSVLMLVGIGDLMDAVKDMVAELGLTDCVVFTGVRADVNELLSAFDVFLFPSLFEGLPVTLIEAQAVGLPVVCSDSITKEVIVSDILEMLPLNQSVDAWANVALSKRNVKREDCVKEKIASVGYDISESSIWLEQFYRNLTK